MSAKSTENKQGVSTSLSTKEIIEREAIALFSEKGYDATSMREIAGAAGVTKPVLYYYFDNKENLCHHVISSGLDDFLQRLQSACEEEAEGIFEQLVRVVDIFFDSCEGEADFMRLFYALSFGPDRKKFSYDFHSFDREMFRMLSGLMRRASETGIIRSGKEEAAVYYLEGIINTYIMLYIDGDGELQPELARTIVTDMVKGLGP